MMGLLQQQIQKKLQISQTTISIVFLLIRFFPNSQEDYDAHPVKLYHDPLKISYIMISPDKVRCILLPFDDNKATGPNRIPATLLKCFAFIAISSLLSDLFSKRLSSGKTQVEWKISNIMPIFLKMV
jgi:hypothetical protein